MALSLLLVAPAAWAEIRETSKMSEVVAEVDDSTLFITDLDNTVVETPQVLGSDQSYDHWVKAFVGAGDAREEAYAKAGQLWVSVQHVTRVKPVEAETPALIRQLQDRGITVLALTARPLSIVRTTERQMKDLGIDFNRRPISAKARSFSAPRPARFQNGVLYSDRNNKGHALTKLLRLLKLRPRKIVFVDDKVKHVTNVHRELAARWPRVKHVEFRYGAADPKVKALDAKILELQLRRFQTLMSDDEARKELQGP